MLVGSNRTGACVERLQKKHQEGCTAVVCRLLQPALDYGPNNLMMPHSGEFQALFLNQASTAWLFWMYPVDHSFQTFSTRIFWCLSNLVNLLSQKDWFKAVQRPPINHSTKSTEHKLSGLIETPADPCARSHPHTSKAPIQALRKILPSSK